MTLSWVDVNLVSDNLITYFFSTQLAFAMGLWVFFLVLMVSGGVEFRFSFIFTLPLLAAYAIGGILGVNIWILHVGIMVAGFLYTVAIVRLMS